MSSPFVGLPISAELSNGTVVEGIVLHIDQSFGKLNLGNARFRRFDGSLSAPQDHLVVDKDSVKDLTLLSVKPPSSSISNSHSIPNTLSSPSPPSYRDHNPVPQSHNLKPPNAIAIHPDSFDLNPDLTPRLPTLPSPNGFQTSLTSTTSTPDSDPLPTSQSNPSSLILTNKSIHPRSKPSRSSPRGRRRKGLRPSQTPLDAHLLNGTSTGGESGFSAREDTDGAPSPEPSPASADRPNSSAPADFSRDFDFQAGLMAFDKAKLWAEIALTDSTDPNDRLVAHNRKKPDGSSHGPLDPPRARNLGPTEMVLSAQEQAANGTTVSRVAQTTGTLLSSDGHPITPVSLNRLTRALTAASVEHGPNLVQRIENASRTMAEFVIGLLRSAGAPVGPESTVCVLAGSQGPKGSCAIRAGTLLANKRLRVVLVLGNGCGDRASNGKSNGARSQAFEFQLRLFNSTGSEIVTDVHDLPSSPTIIIEALAENSTNALNQQSHHRGPDPALVAYTREAATIGIDMPSYVNYDTGEPLGDPSLVPAVRHLVCLAAIPLGVSKMKRDAKVLKEVCLADLSLSDICWEESSERDDEDGRDGREFGGIGNRQEWMERDGSAQVPSFWGDQWWSMVRL